MKWMCRSYSFLLIILKIILTGNKLLLARLSIKIQLYHEKLCMLQLTRRIKSFGLDEVHVKVLNIIL